MRARSADAADSVRYELAAETLRSAGKLRLRATGTSMLPAIWPGDVLHLERRTFPEIQLGDIAVFECYGRLVIHRVRELRADGFLAQGDTLPGADPPVSAAGLLGIVTGIERGGRRINPNPHPALPARAAASVIRRSPQAARWVERVRSLLAEKFRVRQEVDGTVDRKSHPSYDEV